MGVTTHKMVFYLASETEVTGRMLRARVRTER